MTPVRTCIGCRRAGSTDSLVRLVRREDGSLALGHGDGGRGAWLCRDSPGCLDRAVKRKAFDRALRGRVDLGGLDGIRLSLGGATDAWSVEGSESRAL